MLSLCLQRQVWHPGQALPDRCKHGLAQAHLCLVHGTLSSLSINPQRPWIASLGGEVQISVALHSVQMTAVWHKIMTLKSLSGPACMRPPGAAHVGLGCCLPSLSLRNTHRLHLLS